MEQRIRCFLLVSKFVDKKDVCLMIESSIIVIKYIYWCESDKYIIAIQ